MPDLTKDQEEAIVLLFNKGLSYHAIEKQTGLAYRTVRLTCNKILGVPEKDRCKCECEYKEQSYRDNLAWAIASAGEFMRTKQEPELCPNNTAWFLYCQAKDDPQNFMAKVQQIEAKVNDTADDDNRRSTQRSIEEIESMLKQLREEND